MTKDLKDSTKKLCLLLGSNIGNRAAFIETAKALIASKLGEIALESRVYETAAWGETNQQAFYNQAILLNCHTEPLEVLRIVKAIENQIGRLKRSHWAEREIDIDILLYGDIKINSKELTIPHQQIQFRLFALIPLLEIYPKAVDPVSNNTYEAILASCPDKLSVKALKADNQVDQ